MEKKADYTELVVWQRAMALVPDVYTLLKAFPQEETYALADQIRRAVVSIPANIAEGQARQHRKEFIQHLSIAKGRLAELAHPAHDRAATEVPRWRQAAGDRGGIADCRPPAGGADQSSSARLTESNQQPTTSNGADTFLPDPARFRRRMGISLSCNPAP